MFFDIFAGLRASYHLRGYLPQRVTARLVCRWLRQFPKSDRKALRLLLSKVIYVTEDETRQTLVSLNKILLERLSQDGVPITKVVYVQFHDAGSSSGVMLNMLRDAGRLEERGCRFIDGKNILELRKVTEELEEGAIIYVDDFSGTGNQFTSERKIVAENGIVGNFAEFFLLPFICEEAATVLDEEGVEPIVKRVHLKKERPLHDEGNIFVPAVKMRLLALSARLDRKYGRGYRNLSTMIVFYRNAPNSVPLLLRGNKRQSPYFGVIPRTTDLAFE